MSMIIHRCTTCQHPDQFHASVDDGNHQGCSYGACTAPKHEFGPPEVIPSWSPDGKLEETVHAPGSRIQGYPRPTCGCTPCRELYDRLSYASAA